MPTPIGINWKAIWQDNVWGPVWSTVLPIRGGLSGGVRIFPIFRATTAIRPTLEGTAHLRGSE